MTTHPTFGPDRFHAAREAYWAYRSALAAYNEAGQTWGDPQGVLKQRLCAAREVREMYWEYGDSVLS